MKRVLDHYCALHGDKKGHKMINISRTLFHVTRSNYGSLLINSKQSSMYD